jgi:hypothetical protein
VEARCPTPCATLTEPAAKDKPSTGAAAMRPCRCRRLGGARRTLHCVAAWGLALLGKGPSAARAQQYGVIGEAQYSLSMNGVENALQLPLVQGIIAVSAWVKLDSSQSMANRVLLDARPGGGDDAVFGSQQVHRHT